MVDPGWGIDPADIAMVQDFTAAHMAQAGTISRAAGGETFDPSKGIYSGGDRDLIYEGPMRVRVLSTGQSIETGGGELTERDAIISIPVSDVLPHRDDILVCTDGGPDPTLNNRTFRILGVDGGGIFGDARRLSCQSFIPNAQGGVQ